MLDKLSVARMDCKMADKKVEMMVEEKVQTIFDLKAMMMVVYLEIDEVS